MIVTGSSEPIPHRAGATPARLRGLDRLLRVAQGMCLVPRDCCGGSMSKAGERHWHGAKADTTMGHITITLVGSQAVQE
jgi:hypothetical protein